MHVAIRWVTAPGKISTLLLLAVVPIAIAIPADLVLSQSSTGNMAQIPPFSAIDLNPPGFTFSYALGISHGEQVGFGEGPATGGIRHALLWHGSAESVVDLNPPGFTTSQAFGTCSGQEVGDGWGPAIRGFQHALLWRGSAVSVVDLHPPGFEGSEARGTSCGEQVGRGFSGQCCVDVTEHPLPWRGYAASMVDLYPDGRAFQGFAFGVSGGQQVGIVDRRDVMARHRQ